MRRRRRGVSGTPTILKDGNTVAWFDYKKNITIATGVSVWGDRSELGHNLIQPTTTKQPVLNSDGILFDGTSDWMRTATFPLEQPTMVYIVFKHITWTQYDRVFDGYVDGKGAFRQNDLSPELEMYAGIAGSQNNNLALGTFAIARILFNGVSSFSQINETSAIVGNAGAGDMDGFTLGARGNDAAPSHINVKEVIVRKSADSTTNQTIIYNYLKSKYGL